MWGNKEREGTFFKCVNWMLASVSIYETEGFNVYTLKPGKVFLLSSFGDVCCVCMCTLQASFAQL